MARATAILITEGKNYNANVKTATLAERNICPGKILKQGFEVINKS